MKILYYILLLSLIACSQKESNVPVESSKEKKYFVSRIKGATPNSSAIYADSVNMERYQTFDEYTMSGKGRAKYSPFVYVKKHKDSILVISSNRNDSVRLYVKLDDKVWYSHMEYDMWKKDHFVPSKDKLSKTARVYDRFFYNDTILEVKTDYISGEKYHVLFVKCKTDMYCIRGADHVEYLKIDKLRNKVHKLILSNDKSVNKYALIQGKKQYVYKGERNGNNYSYERKAYGLWGIQPGVDENNLYGSIDIREYSDNLKRFQHFNTNYIYEEADVMPKFPGGTSTFYDFVKNNRDHSLILNDNTPNRVILEIIIEKDGSITNAKVVKSIDLLHDNDALSIIRKMPNWTPAKLNDSTVRFKMKIPISYKR